MLLDDFFQHIRCAGVIPNAFGVNDRDRPIGAHAQAIDLAAIDQRLGAGELQVFEALLEELPGHCGLFGGRAMRLSLIGTKKNMPFVFGQAEFARSYV